MNAHFIPTVADFRRMQQFRPNYSEIARELKVTPTHVRRVAMGASVSARVTRAIERHIQRKAREAMRLKKVAA